MEVTHLNPYRIGVKGGVEASLYLLIPYLNSCGIKTNCLVGGVLQEDSPKWQQYNKYLDINFEYSDSDLNDFIQNNHRVFARTHIFNFHNLHIEKHDKTIRLINILKKIYPRARLIANIHNINDDPISWEIIKMFGKNNVVAYSKYVADQIKKQIKITAYVLPPVYQYEVKQYIRDSNFIDILQPTRFNTWKGSHLSLISVVELLDEGHDLKFTHAGISRERLSEKWEPMWNQEYPELYEKVTNYYESGKIDFQVYLYEEMLERIGRADVILHPTIGLGISGEPFSISICQSVILNKYIIASNSGNLPYIANPLNYKSARIVNADDQLDLKNAMKEVVLKGIPEVDSESKLYSENIKNIAKHAPEKHLEFYKKIYNNLF